MINLETLQTSETQRELTVREIWNRILKGEVVKIPNDPTAASQLKNHLNVIKSREKKLFLDLGLDFISSVISVRAFKSPPKRLHNPEADSTDYIEIPNSEEILGYEIHLIAPKKKRTFTAFVIKQPKEKENDASTVI